MEKEVCSAAPCGPDEIEVTDPECPTTDWSDWSPCSASCGKGVKMRMKLLLVEPDKQQFCSTRVELIQQYPCEDVPTCEMDMNVAKGKSILFSHNKVSVDYLLYCQMGEDTFNRSFKNNIIFFCEMASGKYSLN